MSEHAEYGGSTIKRTFECPGWANFCAKLPPQKSSEFADRGTLLHNAMEKIYTEDVNFEPRSLIGSEYEGIVLTAELYEEKIVPALAAVEEIFEKYNVEEDGFECESRVTISNDVWGTADLLAGGEYRLYDEGEDRDDPKAGELCKVGICLDYKFGDGILVSAIDNDQGLFYATAAAITEATEDLFQDIDILVIAIVQPNERGEPDYTLWPVDPAILTETRLKIRAAVDLAEAPAPGFNSGDHCNFCTARGLCPATSGEVSAMLRLDVTAPDLLGDLPTFVELAQAEKTIKAIRALVHAQLDEGVEIPGFKLVPKRASRVYTDEPAVREIIRRSKKIKRAEAYQDTLFTPPQLEKMCKAKELDFDALFGEYVDKISSGTTLADESDKRKAVPGLAGLKALLERD